MSPETTCCFTGPRPKNLPVSGIESSAEIAELKEKIRLAVKDAYAEGFRFFISGMAEGFDLFAAEAVVELKNELSGIGLIAALPYADSAKYHSAAIAKRMESVLQKADAIISIEKEHIPGCEHRRNIYMVENSTRIIGYYNGLSGGTAHCWNYALQKGLEMVNLYEFIE
ncbi:MAG: DUF1273 family protein [Oscillospiraceae bacterium]|nr:DUF1273 family protein [Oscillospiraceae bacterium]